MNIQLAAKTVLRFCRIALQREKGKETWPVQIMGRTKKDALKLQITIPAEIEVLKQLYVCKLYMACPALWDEDFNFQCVDVDGIITLREVAKQLLEDKAKPNVEMALDLLTTDDVAAQPLLKILSTNQVLPVELCDSEYFEFYKAFPGTAGDYWFDLKGNVGFKSALVPDIHIVTQLYDPGNSDELFAVRSSFDGTKTPSLIKGGRYMARPAAVKPPIPIPIKPVGEKKYPDLPPPVVDEAPETPTIEEPVVPPAAEEPVVPPAAEEKETSVSSVAAKEEPTGEPTVTESVQKKRGRKTKEETIANAVVLLKAEGYQVVLGSIATEPAVETPQATLLGIVSDLKMRADKLEVIAKGMGAATEINKIMDVVRTLDSHGINLETLITLAAALKK